MIAVTADAVSRALRDPAACAGLTLAQWEVLIPQARSANLLARLATSLAAAQLLDRIPSAPRAHLDAGLVVAAAQRAAARREIAHIRAALAPTGVDIVLLKGSAYLMANLPTARGRMFSDIDILVPRARLPEVEAALMLGGWATTHHHPYDQRYYRQWMHELPPMQHVGRSTVIDVHHAILPETARAKPDSEKLLAAAIPLAGEPRLKVLAPADMVLHSATHLFFNEVFDQGLRDLADLDSLLRHFASTPQFWAGLVARARELDLTRPLHYGLRYTQRILGTPIPADVIPLMEHGKPGRLVGRGMDSLFARALRPDHPDAGDSLTPAARYMLYVRGHWLRMPPLMLVRHLATKALRRDDPEPAQGDPAA
jgi:hypothetical protein